MGYRSWVKFFAILSAIALGVVLLIVTRCIFAYGRYFIYSFKRGASIGSFPVSDWFLFFSLFVYCFCILDQLDAAVKLIRATEFGKEPNAALKLCQKGVSQITSAVAVETACYVVVGATLLGMGAGKGIPIGMFVVWIIGGVVRALQVMLVENFMEELRALLHSSLTTV